MLMTYNVFSGTLDPTHFTSPIANVKRFRLHECGLSSSSLFWLHIFTFCVSRRRLKMYCGHVHVCVCLSAAVCPHYCTDPDVTWGRDRGCPLVVHYWADLQLVHWLHCYGNIMRTLVYAGCARVAH